MCHPTTTFVRRIAGIALLVLLPSVAGAQSPLPTLSAPPPVIPVSGTIVDAAGQPRTGPVSVTFSIYADRADAIPVWSEVQVVQLDSRGRYASMLGWPTPGGIPETVFAADGARWFGLRVEGENELERVLLTSVPYALKSHDANTLGGLPPTAFVLSSLGRAATRAKVAADGTLPAGGAPAASRRDVVPGVEPDNVVADDQIVQGSLCVGIDCVNGEVFGFDTIRLRENNTRIKFDDTSVGLFPANDWQLTANDSASGGANYFAVEDITGSKVPFRVDAGARTDALRISSTGKIGIGTAAPVLNVHVKHSDTPAHRLEQDASGGYTAQTWDVAGNEANFFVRDVTGGSKLPFRIRPGAPTSSIDIAATGNVGVGTANPQTKLHLFDGSAALARMRFDSGGGIYTEIGTDSAAPSFGAGIFFGGTQQAHFYGGGLSLGTFATADPPANGLAVGGSVGIGTATPQTALHLFNGSVAQARMRMDSGGGIYSEVGVDQAAPNFGAGIFYGGTQQAHFYGGGLSLGQYVNRDPPANGLLVSGLVGFGTTTPTNPLELGSGAYVSAGGVWTNASSRTLKTRIVDLPAEKALDAVARLRPVTYVYKADPGEAHVGFIAEDVPELVATADRRSLSPMDIVAVLTRVVQDQQATIAELEGARIALQAALAELQARLGRLEALLPRTPPGGGQ